MQLIWQQANPGFLLRDGTIATIRNATPADAVGVQQFVRNLSPASRYSRFLVAIRELSEDMLRRFTAPATAGEVVLVASSQKAGIIGMTQYVVDDNAEGCEFAIVVGDAWQRQGLGYRLLSRLSHIAAASGVRYAHADVLADNRAMRSLAHKLGCTIRTNFRTPYLLEIRKDFDAADALPLRAMPERSGIPLRDQAPFSTAR